MRARRRSLRARGAIDERSDERGAVGKLARDDMNYLALALHLTFDAHQARTHHDRSVRLEDFGPDDQVGDPAFIL